MMECLGVLARFRCLCNVQAFMQCSGVDVMFACLFHSVRDVLKKAAEFGPNIYWEIEPRISF